MVRKKKEFGFKVVDVECSKCSRRAEGHLYVERDRLSYSGSDGFIVYPDGIVCSWCLGERSDVRAGRGI